jgi:hypothetical protein
MSIRREAVPIPPLYPKQQVPAPDPTAPSITSAAYINTYERIAYYENIRALKLQDQRFFLELGWIRNASRPLSSLGEEYIKLIEDSQKV